MARWIPWVALFAAVTVFAVAPLSCSSSQKSAFEDTDAGVDAGDDSGNGDDTGLVIPQTDAPGCINLQCQQTSCPTSLSGTVYAPNGTLPLYNVIVYVPNGPLDPLPKGVSCDKCGAIASGSPLTTALSDSHGHFVLNNMPAGTNIPLVVQLGKWRRQTTISNVTACAETKLVDPNLTRLPKNQKEGNMPHIALTTGGCDSLGCMLPKTGIDPKEFGYESDGYNKAINVYNGENFGGGLPMATPASNLWGAIGGPIDDTNMKKYDISILSCECSEAPGSKGTFGDTPFSVVTKYLKEGGRIFTTDFQYTWYKFSPDTNLGGPGGSAATGLGSIIGGAPSGADPITVDSSFPKGKALADWIKFIFPTNTYGSVQEDYVFSNIQAPMTNKAQVWANSGMSSSGPAIGPRVFTVNTPVGKPTDQQCGKGVHIDTHTHQPGSGDEVNCTGSMCYPATCTLPFQTDDALFAFLFFDLSACIQNDSAMPMPPPPIH